MFDWISDAIDWIGDGISSLWDNTIGSAVDTITDAIWDVMFEWLFNLILVLSISLDTFYSNKNYATRKI